MDPVLLRFAERLAAVLIGGLAIYLGYRLFREVPQQRDAQGRVTLPWNVSVVFTRVGPGAFFALFGTAAVTVSLLSPLRLGGGGEGPGDLVYSASVGERSAVASDAMAETRIRLQRELAVLNSVPELLQADLDRHSRDDVLASLARVKLALLEPLWGRREEGFGDRRAFRDWVLDGARGEPPPGNAAALRLFRWRGVEPGP